MSSDDPVTSMLPGDRYVTTGPCGPFCAHASLYADRKEEKEAFLEVAPYSHVYTAATKGRWIGIPLLALFVREFAYVAPSVLQATLASSDSTTGTKVAEEAKKSSCEPARRDAGTTSSSSSSSSASPLSREAVLDCRVSMPAYAQELCEGTLWLKGREAECLAAGRQYCKAIIDAYMRETGGCVPLHIDKRTIDTREEKDDEAAQWARAQHWLALEKTNEEAKQLLDIITSTPPQLLVLRQKDVVQHRVWRREGRMDAHEPLHVTRADVASAHASSAAAATQQQQQHQPQLLRLLVVSKPSGLPVHPSGSYRKNSVTSILEDVFGGCDHHLYTSEERQEGEAEQRGEEGLAQRRYVSIIHKQHGFELIRVWLRPDSVSSAAAPKDSWGVTREEWAQLQQWLLRGSARANDVGSRPAVIARSLADATTTAAASEGKEALKGAGGRVAGEGALKVFVVHRLDAATSGVLLFGLDSEGAHRTAEAIAHKEESEEKAESPCTSTAAAAKTGMAGQHQLPTCTKVYLAKVQGRLDTAALAARYAQDGASDFCHLMDTSGALLQLEASPSSFPSTTMSPSSAHPCGGDAAVRVNFPIGCLSFHQCLYWSPGPCRARRWDAEQQMHKSQTPAAAMVMDAAAACVGKKTKKDPAALAAKHARMRALTRGERRPQYDAPTTPQYDSPEHNFELTLRRASSIVRALWYNAAADETLVECRLLTGRTHQLRVHLALLGHPIVWDAKYVDFVKRLREVRAEEKKREGPRCDEPLKEADDAAVYYQHIAPQYPQTQPPDGGVAVSAVPCMCPGKIQLHAWKYTLSFPHCLPEVLVAPPPQWAQEHVGEADHQPQEE